ncbi:MAG TPA: hypothetical protein VF808_18450 [Ktedonobacterales bacterium]
MDPKPQDAQRYPNGARFRPGAREGHYESFFVRANHPTRPLAFWIRYTIFSPRGRPGAAVGELWAIAFDGETGQHVAVKRETPFAECAFDPGRLDARVGGARLDAGALTGEAASGGHTLQWNLTYSGEASPLFLLPLAAYSSAQPPAKSLVARPFAVFSGTLVVDGAPLRVERWTGSQNHNWGPRHTDHYAWGQVAGFDNAPDTFLEVVTARRRLGPFWSPFVTLLVVRRGDEEIALNSPAQMRRARGAFTPFDWRFRSATSAARVEGLISAPDAAFVGLTYHNPPGGDKTCLNSKLATCELTLTRREGATWGQPERLIAQQRAAFEILTDTPDPRVPLRV